MPLLQTEALTLRRRRTKDADALVTLFCKEGGKITASTKSVLKTTSRYAGVTQPFNHLQVMLYAKTETQDIWTLTQVGLIETFEHLRTDLTRMAYACCLAEWVDFLSDDMQSNYRVWTLLLDAFHRWNESTPSEEKLFYYQWHMLTDAGFAPEIYSCLATGKTDSKRWYYHSEQGGIVHPVAADTGHLIHHGSILALRRLDQSPEPPRLKLSKEQIQEIQTLLHQHLEYHVGKRSRANLFLNEWKRIVHQTGSSTP